MDTHTECQRPQHSWMLLVVVVDRLPSLWGKLKVAMRRQSVIRTLFSDFFLLVFRPRVFSQMQAYTNVKNIFTESLRFPNLDSHHDPNNYVLLRRFTNSSLYSVSSYVYLSLFTTSNCVKTQYKITRGEGVGVPVQRRRYSDQIRAGWFGFRTLVGGKRFSLPHIRDDRPRGSPSLLYYRDRSSFPAVERSRPVTDRLEQLRSPITSDACLPFAHFFESSKSTPKFLTVEPPEEAHPNTFQETRDNYWPHRLTSSLRPASCHYLHDVLSSTPNTVFKSGKCVARHVRYVVTSCECGRLPDVMTCEVLFIPNTLSHCTLLCKVAAPALVIQHH